MYCFLFYSNDVQLCCRYSHRTQKSLDESQIAVTGAVISEASRVIPSMVKLLPIDLQILSGVSKLYIVLQMLFLQLVMKLFVLMTKLICIMWLRALLYLRLLYFNVIFYILTHDGDVHSDNRALWTCALTVPCSGAEPKVFVWLRLRH